MRSLENVVFGDDANKIPKRLVIIKYMEYVNSHTILEYSGLFMSYC